MTKVLLLEAQSKMHQEQEELVYCRKCPSVSRLLEDFGVGDTNHPVSCRFNQFPEGHQVVVCCKSVKKETCIGSHMV